MGLVDVDGWCSSIIPLNCLSTVVIVDGIIFRLNGLRDSGNIGSVWLWLLVVGGLVGGSWVSRCNADLNLFQSFFYQARL